MHIEGEQEERERMKGAESLRGRRFLFFEATVSLGISRV